MENLSWAKMLQHLPKLVTSNQSYKTTSKHSTVYGSTVVMFTDNSTVYSSSNEYSKSQK